MTFFDWIEALVAGWLAMTLLAVCALVYWHFLTRSRPVDWTRVNQECLEKLNEAISEETMRRKARMWWEREGDL